MRTKGLLLVLAATAALTFGSVASAHTSHQHKGGCRTHACWHRVSLYRHRTFPKRHPERYRHWYHSVASWYGPGFIGHTMACGGALSAYSMVVANKTMPCGTVLHMCYQRCAKVIVQDRGPYVAGRDFDLTPAVKSTIGFPSLGTVKWRYG